MLLATVIATTEPTLPALVERAAATLASAKTAAEVLVAEEMAGFAYDAAKRAARLARAKNAHDELIQKIYRAQADALDIEAQAKRRLADEYDAAQERGEVAGPRDGKLGRSNSERPRPAAADIGLSRKGIHEAREIRNAEQVDPGIVRRAVDEAVAKGEPPTRAKVRRAVKAKSKRARKPHGHKHKVEESQHDRDLRMLLGVWSAACESARAEFLQTVTH